MHFDLADLHCGDHDVHRVVLVGRGTMTAPQGMSAEDRAIAWCNGAHILQDVYMITNHKQGEVCTECMHVCEAIKEAEAAARADERVTSEKDLAALKCCPKCRAEIEAMHSRDLRAQSYAGEVVKRVEASQERVRVKAWNEALERLTGRLQAGMNRWPGKEQAGIRGAIRIAGELKLPEAQPVEPSPKEEA